MAIQSIGYDGTVDEVQWAKLAPAVGAAQYGVVGAGDWNVSAHPSTDKAVNVAPGAGWGPGVYDISDSTYTVQCDSLTSGTRWDLITAKRDWQPPGGATVFSKVTGGTQKALPDRLTQPGVQDEQPLALVQWTAGQTQPTAIVDLRVWAGNGGMFAKDDLVRAYLTKLGTEVNINGAVWGLSGGANDVLAWTQVSEIGKIPLFGVGSAIAGGVPAGNTHFLVQAGTKVQPTDTEGYANIVFPQPFPNGLLYVDVRNGDSAIDRAYGRGPLSFAPSGGKYDFGNKSQVTYAVSHAGGMAIGLNHRANFIAIGW